MIKFFSFLPECGYFYLPLPQSYCLFIVLYAGSFVPSLTSSAIYKPNALPVSDCAPLQAPTVKAMVKVISQR